MSIVCTEPDHQRFCRRISAVVNQSQVYLSRVMVMGRQVYPTHDAVLGNPDTLLRSEFRIRDSSSSISDAHIQDLLQRLESLEVIEAHTFNHRGSTLDRIAVPLSVGL
ncbi:MAG: hypothetical protein ACKOI2_01165 [Actinomycetota bacterium]